MEELWRVHGDQRARTILETMTRRPRREVTWRWLDVGQATPTTRTSAPTTVPSSRRRDRQRDARGRPGGPEAPHVRADALEAATGRDRDGRLAAQRPGLHATTHQASSGRPLQSCCCAPRRHGLDSVRRPTIRYLRDMARAIGDGELARAITIRQRDEIAISPTRSRDVPASRRCAQRARLRDRGAHRRHRADASHGSTHDDGQLASASRTSWARAQRHRGPRRDAGHGEAARRGRRQRADHLEQANLRRR